MPLFTHHPSLSWPPLSHISSRTHRDSSPKGQASIDEDPFAYFITPPPITDLEEEESIFEDWSAGIAPTGRPRARSLSPFRLRSKPFFVQDDYDDDDDHTVITVSPPKSLQTPTAMRTLRRWMNHFPSPRAPRIQPQELSIDDVPALSPLSASPVSTPPGSPSFSPRGRSRRGMKPIRSHSNRPRSWIEPDEMLWTVVEEDDSDIEEHEQWDRISTVLPPTNDMEDGGEVLQRTTSPTKKSRSKGSCRRRLFKRPRLL